MKLQVDSDGEYAREYNHEYKKQATHEHFLGQHGCPAPYVLEKLIYNS